MERTQITNNRNERGEIITIPMDIKRIVKEHHEQFNEMDLFLKRHNLLKFIQEETI